LNPKYKEKVKIELDRMMEAWIIEPVEESEWISPMVVQDRKTGEINICVDLRCWVCVIFFACVCVGMSDLTTASDNPS
jgi:hypothetical protein